MMDAYWELRTRRTTTSADPALAEFMRLEYPSETAAWLLESTAPPARPVGPIAPSGPHPFRTRILTWLRRVGEIRAAERARSGEETF